MKLFGFEVTRTKQTMSAVPSGGWSGWGGWGTILESFAGAWQRNITCEAQKNLLAFAAVYACVSIRAEDVAKLRIRLMQQNGLTGIWTEVRATNPFSPVLNKPNSYQTRQQFIVQWLVWKLIQGNAYALKERDAARRVRALYLLDSRYVTPLVANDGSVFYQIRQDYLSQVADAITVPASEIIHDRCITPFHPLIGVSPLYGCGGSATQGLRIQAQSEAFFGNQSRPSGQLTAPGTIEDATAARVKAAFEAGFSGANLGKLFVAGNGLKFETIANTALDSQQAEQFQLTVEDVARAYRVPLHKIAAGPPPTFNNIGSLNQDYYGQTLQPDIEAIEALLDEGLGLGNVEGKTYGTAFDLQGLLRMDPLTRAQTNAAAMGAGYLAPDEARASEDLEPVDGGATPYMQKQNWPLAQLAKRPPPADPAAAPVAAPALPAPPAANDASAAAKALADAFIARCQKVANAV